MANKVKIYSTLKSGKVFFDGSRVSSKEIGTLEVEAHPSISNRIRIKSLTQFKRGSSTNYRVFFGKLNIDRIQNEAGQNLVADLGMDRDAVIAHILVQITKPIVTEYFEYNPTTDRLEANKNIEVKKHGFFIGGKYKMASGNSNLYYEDLSTKANSYPVMGEVLDQSLAENQVAGAGFVTPKMRVFGDFQSIPLGGTPVDDTSIAYDGLNFFPFNISGVGITTRIAETVLSTQKLKYEITIDDLSVYIQYLEHNGLAINEDLTWYFDHPLDIESGTTLRATIYKVSNVDNQEQIDGVLNVCEGSATPTRYSTSVLNRFFDDKDLELISPYTKYQAMDFGLDATGSTVFLRDLSLGTDSLLAPHAVNTLEAVANGTTIKIKLKGGAKVLVESLPVSGASINGAFVNSVLNQAVIQLNEIFTNTSGFISPDTFVSSFALSGNNLTLGLNDSTSYTVDVTSLGVDENKFVTNATLNGSIVTLTMNDATSVFLDASGLAVDNDTIITGGSVSGTTLNLTTNDGSIIAIDASALGGSGSSGNPVVSGSVVGTDLVLVLDDASTVTIDASNMINGSTAFAGGADWYHSYGDRAGLIVGNTISDLDSGVAARAPFHFGTALAKGTEFRWNFNNNKAFVLGVWDGATHNHSGTLNSRQQVNWSTGFWRDTSGFRVGTNTALTNTTATGRYVPSFGAPLALRFLNDGHLELVDLSGSTEVEIAKTINPLVDASFFLQLGCDAAFVFPQFVATDTDNLWDIVHDYNGTESGIINGVLDHTVLKSDISIEKGEKIMFMLDEVGQGDFFGTNYTAAGSGVLTAEEQLDNTFIYQTNEAIVMTFGGASDWTPNTSASGYFFAASLHQYRVGGAGIVQGMHSLRFDNDGTLQLWDEDAQERIATATANPTIGSSIHLYFGVKGNRAYYSIPVISKQSLTQGSQPNADYVPTVANQTATVEEGDSLNFQIVSSDNIVNQFVETDAPAWMTLNQNSGILSGTAPAFLGTAADTIVVNCKAGNAVGGTVDFTVTVTVSEIVSSYTNTQSIKMNSSTAYFQGNPANVTSLQRAANGAGSGDAWTINMWIKTANDSNVGTVFFYGGDDAANEGRLELTQQNTDSMVFIMGKNTQVVGKFLVGSFTNSQWRMLTITYSGASTGVVPGDLVSSFATIKMYMDGALMGATGLHQNYGYEGSIQPDLFRIGRGETSQYISALNMNQLAIFDAEKSASDITAMYNSGVTQDLTGTADLVHLYEFGSSIVTVDDLVGNANLTAYGLSASDIVTDAP